VRDLFEAFGGSYPDKTLFQQNLQAIKNRLLNVHKFQLNADDIESVDYIYRVFFDVYINSGGTSYAELMAATDEQGVPRSYLATEENFRVVRDMHRKNLIVPLVGDFAGTKALRSVGRYIKDHGATVAAFYTSNVEQYLFEQGNDWRRFLENVSTFPLDNSSMFIRSSHFAYGDVQRPIRQVSGRRFIQLLSPMAEVTRAFNTNKITGYEDVIRMSR
jgi:hypothetical protein